MLSLIGFIFGWIIATAITFMVINTTRAKDGVNLNDPITAFFEGFTWGPIGILSGLNPREHALGRGIPRMIGGTIGTIVAYNVYQAI